MIYVITGHLGSGKTLLAVTLAVEHYLRKGKRVASNMALWLDECLPASSRCTAIKLPGVPTAAHLESLGLGYEGGEYNEDSFGLVLLDEAGSWLNSRDWSDKSRRGLFTWITHARKYGWDVALVVQDFESLDAQIRRSVTEIYVSCRRLDRIGIPFLPLRLPKVFLAVGVYGGPGGAVYKRWMGNTGAFSWYNTREAVREEVLYTDAGPVDMRGVSTMLSAWHLRGRYLRRSTFSFLRLCEKVFYEVLLSALVVVLSCASGRSPLAQLKLRYRRV